MPIPSTFIPDNDVGESEVSRPSTFVPDSTPLPKSFVPDATPIEPNIAAVKSAFAAAPMATLKPPGGFSTWEDYNAAGHAYDEGQNSSDFIRAVGQDPKGFIKSIPGDIFSMAAAPGTLAYNTAADVISKVAGQPKYGGNLASMERGEDVSPAQKFIDETAKTNPNLAAVANVSKALPELASMMALNPSGAAGRLMALGFSASMVKDAKPLFDEYATESNLPPEQQDAGKLAQLKAGIIQTFVMAPLAATGALVKKGVKPEVAATIENAAPILPKSAAATMNVIREQKGEPIPAVEKAVEPQSPVSEPITPPAKPQTLEQPISRQSEIDEQDALETVQEAVGLNKAQQSRLAELQAKNAPSSPKPSPAQPVISEKPPEVKPAQPPATAKVGEELTPEELAQNKADAGKSGQQLLDEARARIDAALKNPEGEEPPKRFTVTQNDSQAWRRWDVTDTKTGKLIRSEADEATAKEMADRLEKKSTPPSPAVTTAKAGEVPVNGGRVSLSGGDKFHSDISGTIYQVHNNGEVLDVIKDGADYPVRITVRDYKNKSFEPPKPASPTKNLVTPKTAEVTKPDLGELRQNKIKGGTVEGQLVGNAVASRVAPLLRMNRAIAEKNPAAAYDENRLMLIATDRINEVQDYLVKEWNKIAPKKPTPPSPAVTTVKAIEKPDYTNWDSKQQVKGVWGGSHRLLARQQQAFDDAGIPWANRGSHTLGSKRQTVLIPNTPEARELLKKVGGSVTRDQWPHLTDDKASYSQPTPQQGAKGADVGVKPKDALDKAADDARARLSQKRINPGLRSGGIDPTDIDDYAIIAAQHIRNGARTVGELTLKMVKEFGDWIAPHIQDLWDKAKSIGEQKSEPAVSGLMNAFTDEQRKALGMDERSPVERQGHADVFREAEQRMAENPMLGETLLSSLKDHPNREISRVEQVVLMKHKIDVENQYESALKNASENPEDADAKTAADVAGEKVKRLVEISEKIGTESARNLEFRKAMINRDFSLSTMVMEARKTRGWRNLTPDELKEVTDQHNEIQATEKQRILDEQAFQKALADAEASSKHEEESAQPKYSKGVLDYAERFAKFMDKQGADAYARIMARRREGRLMAGIDPIDFADHAIFGAAKITRGMVDAGEWAASMIKDFGDYIKPDLDKLWKASWAKHDSELGKLDMEKKLGKPMAEKIKRAIYKKPTEEVALNRRLTQLGKREAEYKARTAAKDFAPKKKPVSNIQTEAAKQKVATSTAKADAAKRAWQEQGARYKFSQLSPISKAARGVWWAASRLGSTVAVAFHGTVFMMTHAGALAYRPTLAKMYWTNFARQWKLWASPKFYDKMAYEIKTDQLYADAKAAGVGVDPDKTVTDYELYLKSSSKWISRILGGQGALALKLTRLAQYKKEVAKIPDWIRKDPEQLAETKKMLGGMINKATGTTNLFGKLENLSVSKIAHTILFAPKLYASRWARIVVDVPKTLATLSEWSMVRSANKFAGREWKEPSLADKYMAIQRTKHAAEFAATYVAMLAVNQGLNMVTGSNQTVNAFHPSQSDWLKFKIGGKVVTADGGLLDPVRIIGQIVANDLMPRTAQDRFKRGNNFEATVKDLGKYVRGKFSPSFGIIVDDLSGQDFQGRSVPRVAPIPLPRAESQYKSQTPEGIGEYALSKSPIPVADASKLIYDTMRERGLSAPQALTIMAGAATAAMATTGVGVREDYKADKEATPAPVKIQRIPKVK